MSLTDRPRRSILYLPGSNPRALEKALKLPADGVILDLEDAVAPSEKGVARDQVAAAVRAGGFGAREVIVRVNGLDTKWGAQDLVAAAGAGPDAILIPKVETPGLIADIAGRIAGAGAPARTQLWAMMETPLGILNAAQIAGAHKRLTCLVLGTNDLVNDLHAQHTTLRLPVLTALSTCLLAGRAHGLAVIDGVYSAFRDDEGLRAACVQGRELGFDGKTLIHPSQIPIANEIFAPSEGDLALARRYVKAFADAEEAGQGVAVVDGRIVEGLHVENAKRLIALADAIAARAAESV